MVAQRIIYSIFLLTVLPSICFSASGAAKPQLILLIDKSESILGRPIRAELYGVALKTKITDIKLDKLNNNFGVVTDFVINDTNDERWPNQSVQILKFKLYPRITGNIDIPSLSTDTVSSKSIKVHIDTNQTDKPAVTLSTSSPYQRQQFIIQISIVTSDPSARLSINNESIIKNFESNPILFARTKEKSSKHRLTVGWALTALKDGTYKIKLPPIEYSVSGVSRKQFYLPIQTVHIRKLPEYLPPTIPVGKISIQSQLPSTWLLKTDSIAYWTINLSGNVSNPYNLPSILRQIKSNSNFKVFPEDSKRSNQVSHDNYESSVKHSIPFKVLNTGVVKLPKLRVQYFDPNNGTIKILNHPQHSVMALSLFWMSTLTVLTCIILFYLYKLARKKRDKLKYSKLKRAQALQLLNGNNEIDNVRETIRYLTMAEYWPKNISLQQWAKLWREKYKTEGDFNEFITKLSSCLYGSKTDCNIKELNNTMLNLIKDRKRI